MKLGKAASVSAKTLAAPSAAVMLTFRGLDKYALVDGDLTLPDVRDLGTVMLASGMARPYGGGKKSGWCKRVPLPPARPAGL